MKSVYVMTKEAMGKTIEMFVFTSAEKAVEHIMGGKITELQYSMPMSPSMTMPLDPETTGFRTVALKLKHDYGIQGKVDNKAFRVQRVNVNPPLPDKFEDVL